jgi:hypothetical protein
MSTWTNKPATGTTSWTPDIDSSTTTWDTHEGFDAEASQFGVILSEAGISGTYTSPAQAAQSFIGSRYKINDNRNLLFGFDDDVKMRYDTSAEALVLEMGGKVDLFSLSATGLSVSSITFTELDALPAAIEGKVAYYNNNLYIAKGV